MLDKSGEVCIKAKSATASLPFKGQVTERTTVTWFIRKRRVTLSHPIRSKVKINRDTLARVFPPFLQVMRVFALSFYLCLVSGCVGLRFTIPVELHFLKTSIWNRSC